jgi:hypothetical protein
MEAKHKVLTAIPVPTLWHTESSNIREGPPLLEDFGHLCWGPDDWRRNGKRSGRHGTTGEDQDEREWARRFASHGLSSAA